MTGRRSWRWTAAATVAGLAATLVISGCGSAGGGKENGTADQKAPAAAPTPAEGGGPAKGTGQDKPQGGNNPVQAPVKLVPENRAIVYTGSTTVRVSDVDAAANATVTIAAGAQGFVGGDNRTSDDKRSEAKLTLRVPSDKFTAVLTEIAKLGKELNRSVSTEDVTEQVVDVNSRVATAQQSVDRVRALLARAQTIGEIVQLEAEVARRESELESLKARQRRLADLTALSTITVILVSKDAPAKKAEEPESGFLAGLKGGWDAFLASLNVLLTILGALLPWFLALGFPVLLLVWLLRRASARRTTQEQPAKPAG